MQVGDLVMLSTKHAIPSNIVKHAKLQPAFTGPYKITKVINENAYELDLPSTIRCHPVINISFLKRFVPSDLPSETSATPTVEANGEQELDRILTTRYYRRKRQFLVRWKNDPEGEEQWKNEESLPNAKELIKDFLDRHDAPPRRSKRGRVSRA